MIGGREETDDGRFAFPSHGLSKVDNGLDAIEQIPIPVLLQDSPAPFNGIVFGSDREDSRPI